MAVAATARRAWPAARTRTHGRHAGNQNERHDAGRATSWCPAGVAPAKAEARPPSPRA